MAFSSSLPIAAVETRQGMYKEYSVDTDTSNPLDTAPRTYKTAEETEESSNKVCSVFYKVALCLS